MKPNAIVARLESILAEHKPCGIRQEAGKTVCNGEANGFTPCCQGCKLLTPNGCSVNSVSCKFYLCDSAWKRLSCDVQDEIRSLLESYKPQLYFRNNERVPIRDKYAMLGHRPKSADLNFTERLSLL